MLCNGDTGCFPTPQGFVLPLDNCLTWEFSGLPCHSETRSTELLFIVKAKNNPHPRKGLKGSSQSNLHPSFTYKLDSFLSFCPLQASA